MEIFLKFNKKVEIASSTSLEHLYYQIAEKIHVIGITKHGFGPRRPYYYSTFFIFHLLKSPEFASVQGH
jgi:hypothetical protein